MASGLADYVDSKQKTLFISTHLFQGFIKNPWNKPVKSHVDSFSLSLSMIFYVAKLCGE